MLQKVVTPGLRGVTVRWGEGGVRVVKDKERVPVPVAGPAFRGGVKFVMFYVLGGFLQPATKIDPVQSPFTPVGDPHLRDKDKPFDFWDER